MTYRIGIDSGGTHITAIAYADKKEIATAQSGPGNIFLNPDQTVQNLVSVVKDIVNTLPNDKCECILIGIAGLETLKDPFDRKEIAGFSKEIGKLAEENNGDAIKVLKHQGNLLADEIIGLIARCKNNDETANNLALSGSVLVNNTLIKNIIENRVQEEFPDIKVTVSKSSNTDAVNYFKKEE
ncbi:N-acetylglucosamine kinase [Lactobacillus hominis]|uniref:N-acetylglucosamine kinase n=1 Tax=Lactobacillus hominis DSM 23910 = CRBIP 24.179 TaxID=1423758 RepID=I7JV91_9LACO|nr:N-acetylglucosamine kinase [Lactobacillus hominis]KRM84892.1 hypothetical protein FC41_GL001811 [Lactobacillus hominis DSM 23910 = CRBIP 24.179]MCT3348032.1 hypothetical protein [Lactobacillus hominis]CCI82426.1 N-acetylglucosamine kinase [Lactobacillus hominis DSM 23910 = CRBIP 24.179]